MNPVIDIDENDPMYSELVNIVNNADDSKLTIVARIVEGHLVLTDPDFGLTEADVEKAKRILEGK